MQQPLNKLLFIALFCITACKKEVGYTQLQQNIVGSWELSKSYVYTNVSGGIIDYTPGNGNIITFSNDGHISQTIVNRDTVKTTIGKYSWQKEDNCDINLLIKADNPNDTYKYHIAIKQDTMIMSAGSCIADAGSAIYLRK